jgi:hypothetical protein
MFVSVLACAKAPPEPAAQVPTPPSESPPPATPPVPAAPPVETQPAGPAPAVPTPLAPTPAAASVPDQALAAVWKAYHRVRAFLAHDDKDGTRRVAGACATEVREAAQLFPETMQEAVLGVADACEQALHGESLDDQRRAFAEATTWLRKTLAALPEAARAGYVAFKCAMVKDGHGVWLQKDGEPLGNPYMGDQMAECGAKVGLIE